MPRIELPGDNWAELADPLKVTQKRRRPVQRIMYEIVGAGANRDGDYLTSKELDLLEQFNDRLIVAFVTAWSYTFEISVDGLGDLPADAYDALQEAVAPLSKEMLPNFEAGPSDPKAPTSAPTESDTASAQDESTSPTNTPEPTS